MGWLALLLLGTVVITDQLLKRSVLSRVGEDRSIEVHRFLRVRPALSRRTIARRLGVRPIVLAIVWMLCLLAVLAAPSPAHWRSPAAMVALGIALGGAGSNLLDVLARGGVVDFVEVGAWPAFNLADMAIVSGVIAAILVR